MNRRWSTWPYILVLAMVLIFAIGIRWAFFTVAEKDVELLIADDRSVEIDDRQGLIIKKWKSKDITICLWPRLRVEADIGFAETVIEQIVSEPKLVGLLPRPRFVPVASGCNEPIDVIDIFFAADVGAYKRYLEASGITNVASLTADDYCRYRFHVQNARIVQGYIVLRWQPDNRLNELCILRTYLSVLGLRGHARSLRGNLQSAFGWFVETPGVGIDGPQRLDVIALQTLYGPDSPDVGYISESELAKAVGAYLE